ncbi:hypothetical protein [Lentzea xinjiangensis]|uniref:hypothetical protein n=1 Tax=Lentzea xinjiangensis TaxID=402600 RepID=UPI0011608AB8|nr:hypothetical protein [Lentzea xinjiangensis]
MKGLAANASRTSRHGCRLSEPAAEGGQGVVQHDFDGRRGIEQQLFQHVRRQRTGGPGKLGPDVGVRVRGEGADQSGIAVRVPGQHQRGPRVRGRHVRGGDPAPVQQLGHHRAVVQRQQRPHLRRRQIGATGQFAGHPGHGGQAVGQPGRQGGVRGQTVQYSVHQSPR